MHWSRISWTRRSGTWRVIRDLCGVGPRLSCWFGDSSVYQKRREGALMSWMCCLLRRFRQGSLRVRLLILLMRMRLLESWELLGDRDDTPCAGDEGMLYAQREMMRFWTKHIVNALGLIKPLYASYYWFLWVDLITPVNSVNQELILLTKIFGIHNKSSKLPIPLIHM